MVNIGKYDESYLLERAEEIVIAKTTGSNVMDPDAEEAIPRFHPQELEIGAILGKGGFCTVSEVSKISLTSDAAPTTSDDFTANILQDRHYMAQNYLRNGMDSRYAIKTLSNSLMKDPERFVAGVIDLVIETKFLSIIRHPNIIKMRAISDQSPYSRGYYLVLDRLFDTLSVRLEAWKSQKSFTAGIGKVRDLRGNKKKELWIDRLMVSYDLCMALKYLHDNNIVYRDLKPDNIGFDVRGDVKIFDFGLAKEMRSEDLVSDDLYDMSGNTGSLRYMAPEVARRKPYNHTVDVYSFAILFWQICSLEVPFESYDVNKHSELVVHGRERPKLSKSWSADICSLMTQGWSAHISERPEFEDVGIILRREFSPFITDSEVSALDESSKTAKSIQNR
mmetsp:Transcript_21148/g.31308  ORF Transcript_21148/g.31308 Transcript_21148/m.31308 type:complete len:392 (-) Transcript_21148:151-1326(-)